MIDRLLSIEKLLFARWCDTVIRVRFFDWFSIDMSVQRFKTWARARNLNRERDAF